MFENPNSSKAAKVWCAICPDIYHIQLSSFQILVIVSSLFLLASICMLILSTIPEFQVRISKIKMVQLVGFVYVGGLAVNICV